MAIQTIHTDRDHDIGVFGATGSMADGNLAIIIPWHRSCRGGCHRRGYSHSWRYTYCRCYRDKRAATREPESHPPVIA